MKTIKAAISLLLLGSASAIAADLPSIKSVTAAVPTPIWTGFYAGLNAGGTWFNVSQASFRETPVWSNPTQTSENYSIATAIAAARATGSSFPVTTPNAISFMGGIQFGYSERLNNYALVGVETDLQGVTGAPATNVKFHLFGIPYFSQVLGKTNINTIYNLYTVSKNISYVGTLRGRAGYLLTPSLLVYGTAGLAYGEASVSTYINQQKSATVTEEVITGAKKYSGTQLGWTAGGGVEWIYAQNWSLKAEYLYYNLNPFTIYAGQAVAIQKVRSGGLQPGVINSISNFSTHIPLNGNIVRVGINYHFNISPDHVPIKLY